MKRAFSMGLLIGILGGTVHSQVGYPAEPGGLSGPALRLDAEERLTLAGGLSVPQILDARGFPPHGPVRTRPHPLDDDRVRVLDLWRADQHVAAWRTPGTNRVTLLKLAYGFPHDLMAADQMRHPEDYRRDVRLTAAAGETGVAAEQVPAWLNDYYQAPPPARLSFEATSLNLGSDAVDGCTRYTVANGTREWQVYVFNLAEPANAPVIGGGWYALEVRSPPGAGANAQVFVERFLNGMQADYTALAAEHGFWMQETFDTFAHANAVRGVRNLGGEWEFFRRGSFCLITDRAGAVRTAEAGLEAQQRVYDLFPTVLYPFGPASLDDVCVIRVYATGWEFEETAPVIRRWAGGFYVPTRDEIVMRGWSREGTVHESAHRYLHLACGKQGLSAWFDEGFACYLSGCRVAEGRLVAKPVNTRHLLFNMIAADELATVEAVFTARDFYLDRAAAMDPKDPEAARQRAKNYAAAWGVVYFLREAPAFFPGKGYELLIPLYWETLRQTGRHQLATEAVLAKLSLPVFLADFRTYFLDYADRVSPGRMGTREKEPVYDLEHEEFMPRAYRPVFMGKAAGDDRTTTGTRDAAFEAAWNSPVRPGTVLSGDDAGADDPVWRARPDHRTPNPANPQRVKRRERRVTGPALGLGLVAVLAGFILLRKRIAMSLLVAGFSVGRLSGEIAEADGRVFLYRVVENGAELGDGMGSAIIPKPQGKVHLPKELNTLPLVAIAPYAFAECGEVTEVTLPDTVTTVGEFAFYRCDALKTVRLPESVTHIGAGAFYLCTRLQDATLPPRLTTVADWTFGRCFRLSSATFSSNAVTEIGNCAFLGCAGLKSVTIPASVTNLGDRAFMWCSGLQSARLDGPLGKIGCEVFAGCTDLRDIHLPGTATALERGAFQGCISLQRLALPDRLTVVGDDAFRGCHRLADVDLPITVTRIGDNAFCDCLLLGRIEIGNRLQTIGCHAFGACHALASVNLPPSLVAIQEAAFSRCSAMNTVTLPAGLSVLGNGAFERCTQLSSAVFLGTMPPASRRPFTHTPDSLTIRQQNP